VTPLLDDLTWRGLLWQCTDLDALDASLAAGTVTGYIGFDPTADSLHVGHLQQIMLLRRLQDAGHRPIALVGGGTGMIGDPGGKSEERNLLDAATIERNREGVRRQLATFLHFGEGGAVLADNLDWLGTAPLLEFLRDVGKAFTVNDMIRKDSVRTRIESRDQGLSFTEFSYMLLQAWDFLQLYDRVGATLQMGGSDQWGNITEGVDLIRRKRAVQAFGVTSPLLLKADGTKFGKTESGTVWLDPARTSPYAFFQFWLQTDDAEVVPLLMRLTLLGREDIDALASSLEQQPGRREAQRALARQLTAMVHGADEARRAERAGEVLFTPDIAALDEDTLGSVLADAPSAAVAAGDLDGLSVVDAMVRTGLASSRGAARRTLEQGGAYVNNRAVAADRPLGRDDALHGRFVVLRSGKRSQAVLVVG
jgi:tyrosyl-tRNA synthetase